MRPLTGGHDPHVFKTGGFDDLVYRGGSEKVIGQAGLFGNGKQRMDLRTAQIAVNQNNFFSVESERDPEVCRQRGFSLSFYGAADDECLETVVGGDMLEIGAKRPERFENILCQIRRLLEDCIVRLDKRYDSQQRHPEVLFHQ